MEKLYKVLGPEGRPHHGGSGKWHLPETDLWMPPIEGELVPCENGYHLCRRQDLVHWLGPVIFEAEYRGEMLTHDNKIVVREARITRQLMTWNDRTARFFAADCAEKVLPIFEEAYPEDKRPRQAIDKARLFADGKATDIERDAARDAAWAAAGAAARDAAWAAAWAAAWDAAGDAAGDAAWAAAWDAARAAAWAAAWDAAGDAAGDAAWAAAWDAAWDAAGAWQTERLFWYLEGEKGSIQEMK